MPIDEVNHLLDNLVQCALVLSSDLYTFADDWSEEQKVAWIKEQLCHSFNVVDGLGMLWLKILPSLSV